MATTLAACNESSGSVKFVELPDVPRDVRQCFDRLVPEPTAKTMTAKQVMSLIADLRRSELEKAQCGSRVISMWEDYRTAYSATERR